MVHALEYNKCLTGKKLRVVVTGYDRKRGYLSGITEGKIVIRFRSDITGLIGKFVDVEITGATPFSLEGEFIGEGNSLILADEEKSSF
jgi:tRNA-2-methylthio-N6-dimethylallyladenosine synthase